MEDIIYLFENITSIQRSIILVGGITFFWSIESIIPLFNFNYKKLKHAIPNFFFTLTTIIVNFSLAFLLLNSADWVVANNFGYPVFNEDQEVSKLYKKDKRIFLKLK